MKAEQAAASSPGRECLEEFLLPSAPVVLLNNHKLPRLRVPVECESRRRMPNCNTTHLSNFACREPLAIAIVNFLINHNNVTIVRNREID